MAEQPKRRRKRRILQELVINEVSLVDRPAQTPARVAILKRHEPETAVAEPPEPPVEKQLGTKVAMTTSDLGHSHNIVVDVGSATVRAGETSPAQSQPDRPFHTHPWIMDEAGQITVGFADGHTHGVANLVKRGPKTVGDLARENLELSERALDAIVKAKSRPGETPEAALARLYGRDDEVNEAVESLR